MDKKYCDNCEKEIVRNYSDTLESVDLTGISLFMPENSFDFCSNKCLKDFVNKNVEK